MIERIALGQEGRAYLLDQLRDGHTLAQAVVGQSHQFRQIYTLLPGDAAALTNFTSGGKLPLSKRDYGGSVVPIPNTDSDLADVIHAHLRSHEGSACIVENALADSSYPYVARMPSVFFCDHEVYHYVLSTRQTKDTIKATVRAAKSIPQFVGVLTRCPVKPAALDRISVDRTFLQRLARDTQVVFAGAYDGESYVIAER